MSDQEPMIGLQQSLRISAREKRMVLVSLYLDRLESRIFAPEENPIIRIVSTIEFGLLNGHNSPPEASGASSLGYTSCQLVVPSMELPPMPPR